MTTNYGERPGMEAADEARHRMCYASAKCQVCGATVVVWKHEGVRAATLRALAMASHVKALHSEILRGGK